MLRAGVRLLARARVSTSAPQMSTGRCPTKPYLLAADERDAAVSKLSASSWSEVEGPRDAIQKEFIFKDFSEAWVRAAYKNA